MADLGHDWPFARVGVDVTVYSKARFIAPEAISLGNSIIIDDFALVDGGQRTTIGDFVHIAAFSSVMGGGSFTMEDFSGLSAGVRIYTGNEDYLGGCLTNPAVPAPYRSASRSFAILRKHAIVGTNAVILPGIEIGEGAVVGAGAVVTRNVEPWTINVGNPATPKGQRRSDRILELEAELRAELYNSDGDYIGR